MLIYATCDVITRSQVGQCSDEPIGWCARTRPRFVEVESVRDEE